ncbi:dynein axonemal intermediate chain 7 [Parambassis ranga]|uniref:Dynein axonemal intermediate chain 7 n=1 Tax=Parambassis ranga TaxID=210632 RepID=A0A6P7JR70_9TELE|nr:protein CASC1 [Parambassis ranga]
MVTSFNPLTNGSNMSSKKGNKRTKAQKLKKKQDEEERRLQEEEEARLRAEREEKERLERERCEEQMKRLELLDQDRREGELKELRYLLEDNHTAVTTWKKDTREKARWDRYMSCVDTPDPEEQREINTFISLWRDDPEVTFTPLHKECTIAVQLVKELQDLLRDSTDPKEAQKYQESITELQEMIHFKYLLTTEEILKKANKNIDIETGNMQTVIKVDKITLCLWANLSKSPRFKGLNFEEVGLGFEIPKQLALSDVAVRILHTCYDHLSLLARMTHLQIHTLSRRSLLGKDTPEEEETKETKKAVEGDTFGAQAVDLLQYTPLGGVFYYDLFELPPQASWVGGWERQEVRDGLREFHYTAEKDKSDESPCRSQIGVSVILPDSVVFLETPHVARWDAAGKQWRMDGITDVSYEKAEAKLSFQMDSFKTFVAMQETYANLPFQSWELQPLGQDSALFTINGALVDLSITIKDNQCMLQSEQQRGLSHLLGKWMSMPALQKSMLNAGINIFVNEYTEKYVSTCGKDPLTEHAAYEQMALFASACAFSWSKWNAKCGAEHLVMQVCEHLGPDPVPRGLWSLYLLGAQRSQKLKITEKSEAFSADHYPGSEFHSTFIHMLRDSMSPEGIARTRDSHYLFVDTVQSLLCATRPLVFS